MKPEVNNAASLGGLLEQMSTEELRVLLNQELHTEPMNEDAIRLIRGILRRRSQTVEVTITPELEKAWEKYQKDSDAIWQESRKKQRLHNWLVRGAAAAAVLAIMVIPVFPQEAGAESLWQTLTRWTAQVVEFFGPTDNDDRIVEYTFRTDNPGLQQVYDTVVEMGITEPVVPMWLPEGYELVECKIEEFPAKRRIHSRFEHEQSTVIFKIEQYHIEVSRHYHKDENLSDTHEYGGIDHQIVQNKDYVVALWHRDNIEAMISTDCQGEEVKLILQSIYDTEDE